MHENSITELEVSKNFASNLKQLRKGKSPVLSQENLANRLNISRASVYSYENAYYVPNAYIAYLIAHYFGINLEDMLCRDLFIKNERGGNIENRSHSNAKTH